MLTWRLRLAWCLLVGSLVGWPVSALTWARSEPQFVLGLSWVAIATTALDVLFHRRCPIQAGER